METNDQTDGAAQEGAPLRKPAEHERRRAEDLKLRKELERRDKVDPETGENDPLRNERAWEPPVDAPFSAG